LIAKRGRPPKGSTAPSILAELVELWVRAANTPMGIVIESKRPNALAQHLYAARREVGGFHDLRVVEDTTCVWIVPRESK
jgi:hypothetical protein